MEASKCSNRPIHGSLWTELINVQIWISETPLAEGAHFEYRPYMVIKLWYQEDYRSPLVIDEIKTPEQKFDKGNNSRVVYFSYNPKEGKWRPPQFTPPA